MTVTLSRMSETIGRAMIPVCVPVQCQTNPPHRILVVDDDHSIRRLNTVVLNHSGYDVDTADDGAAAWNAMNARGYHLLITENEMPKVSGIELIRKICVARIDVPVILASGALRHDNFIREPWLRPAATLLKPYTIDDLVRTVNKVLRAPSAPIA